MPVISNIIYLVAIVGTVMVLVTLNPHENFMDGFPSMAHKLREIHFIYTYSG